MSAAYWNLLTPFEVSLAMLAKDGMTCNCCLLGKSTSRWPGCSKSMITLIVSVDIVKATGTFIL